MIILFRIASSLRRGAALALERPRAGLWTSLALVCALAAVAVAAIAATSVARWTAATPAPGNGAPGASMVVYLDPTLADENAKQLVTELRALPGVQAAELVPATETARRLVAALGRDGSLLEGVDIASLPASVEVALAPGIRDVVAMSPTVRALTGTSGVSDVVVDEVATASSAPDALSALRTIAWSALALFAGLALVVTLAAIRVRLEGAHPHARREVEVAQLLGAGPGFIVVPTALAGAIHGAVAALVATILVILGVNAYGGAIADALAPSLGANLELAVPDNVEMFLFVAVGGLIGLVGGLLAGASRVAK